eukprot:1106229-Rhodomonas_salina.2
MGSKRSIARANGQRIPTCPSRGPYHKGPRGGTLETKVRETRGAWDRAVTAFCPICCVDAVAPVLLEKVLKRHSSHSCVPDTALKEPGEHAEQAGPEDPAGHVVPPACGRPCARKHAASIRIAL